MMYWIILIVLAVLILVTIIATIVTIVKERKDYKSYELDEEDDDIDDDIEEEDYEVRPPKRRKKQVQEEAPSSGGRKRRWKIILENTDTGEQYDFIFYDALGIGRTTKEVAFEEFLPLPDDRKVSKVHCSIVRSKDKLYLRDEGSKNHTYLNGRKIQKPILLQKQDIISIGETDLEVIKIMREAN
ncbi:FHA domain-containing protein [Faecalicatena sp. AGMB00832]|uniref:FHA domain-containing protein n=1 Tax=Faecalicatena faecalis TaxID=2726362 RepID=A0ABS6D4I2_9FIRM|nr:MULTISPECIES: FHA domain-containing protein [Faecalicatena]MBU3876502.1 FHA domain-containing protein [Faecalicatena faecalis]MCI6465366.1 FHA domain-containing protein [Faecalicatena sp.]MDY5617198.1 FHA domain-containing protein [Lachnospiraceae bacterium]